MKYVAPSAPLTIGGVLDNWLRLFRASFGACWPLALLVAVAGVLFEFAITPTLPPRGATALQNYIHSWSSFRGRTTPILGEIIVWLTTTVVYGALLAQQTALVRGEGRLSFGDALTKGLSRLPQLLLGTVLLVLIILAVFIPVGIAAAVAVPLRHSPTAILVFVLIVIAVAIVFIYLVARLQLWMAVMFSENLGGASSLGRSWDLVKGQWWRVTGVTFVSSVIIWILSAAIGVISGLIVGVSAIHGATMDVMLRRMQLIGAAGQISQLLTLPLLTAMWLAIYQDVRLRREGGDLAARVEALTGS
jgi:hypothetical protein